MFSSYLIIFHREQIKHTFFTFANIMIAMQTWEYFIYTVGNRYQNSYHFSTANRVQIFPIEFTFFINFSSTRYVQHFTCSFFITKIAYT